MKRILSILGACIVLLAVSLAEGAVIYEKPLYTLSRGLNSDLDSYGDPPQMLQQIGDPIKLTTTYQVTDVHWFGSYQIDGVPQVVNSTETFVIRFFANDATGTYNLPQATPFYEYQGTATTRDTGIALPSGPGTGNFYEFSIDLVAPPTLLADTIYWLSILDVGRDYPDLFRWASSLARVPGVTFSAYRRESTDELWTITSPGRAFSLTANVPEPATLALFGLGLAGIGAIRRKKLAA